MIMKINMQLNGNTNDQILDFKFQWENEYEHKKYKNLNRHFLWFS